MGNWGSSHQPVAQVKMSAREYCVDSEAMGNWGSSHQPVAQEKMSAGEIVNLLPSLSPGLSDALLQFEATDEGMVVIEVAGPEVERLVKQVCEGFAAELKALLGGAVEQGGGSDVILQQLSFCLLLALAPSLPNARGIFISEGNECTYGGEQAVEVLYSTLLSQHRSNAVRRITIKGPWPDAGPGAFGSERGCEHLAHLLKSDHCQLQQLDMWRTAMRAGGVGHIARALETNTSLTVLNLSDCQEVGDGGVEQLAAMLRTNSTLRQLTLWSIGMTADGLRHLCDALSTQQSRLQATSSSPSTSGALGSGLKLLDISSNKIGEGGAALLGAMLANNRCLQRLLANSCSLVEEEDTDGEGHLGKGLWENSTLQELSISANPGLGKVALDLVRHLATNKTTLKVLGMGDMGGTEMPPAKELADMITSNHSLTWLGLRGALYDPGEWASTILPALGRNKTIKHINLIGCSGVGGDQVRASLFDLLRINTTIQEIYLHGTPLDKSGEAEAVRRELGRNKEFRHALSALPKAKPKSCRIVLCGHPYAGKSSLLHTMKLLQQPEDSRPPMSSSASEHPLSIGLLWDPLSFGQSSHNNSNNKADLKDKELSKRTRGIDIHLFKDEPDLRTSVWDLAGHREFHALHDCMFPSGNNSATLFVLTFSPIVSPMDEHRAGERKTMRELEEELQYWLRFIASNSKPSAAPPWVLVVITHKDTLSKLGNDVTSWLRSAQDIIARLATKFNGRVEVRPQPFMVNALATEDVALRSWVEVVEKTLRSTLNGLEDEPCICTQVLKAVQDVESQICSKNPIISRAEFTNICSSVLQNSPGFLDLEVQVEDERAKSREAAKSLASSWLLFELSNLRSSPREIFRQTIKFKESHFAEYDKTQVGFVAELGDKIGRAVAAYLHDAGEVIQHDKLDMIISNPRWFCQGVLGQLIDLFPSSQGVEGKRLERPKNGLVSRSYLSSLLQEAATSIPGPEPVVVKQNHLIQLMLLLDLCYEQTPGDPNTAYFLPAIFHDVGNKAANGERPLRWCKLKRLAQAFVGRRLQCGDLELTFLTDGFFPRLQVVLHNHAVKEKWVKDWYSDTYTLEKNLISIWVNGMEIFIEFSGSSGYFVDILVKSSKPYQQTMEFLSPNIIGIIHKLCASQEGCQGVTLVEAIIRPECLYGGDGGNPILCAHRRDQSVLVEELTNKLTSLPDWEHCWDKVEDGAEGLVLDDGQDSATVLLEGTKGVAPGPEPNYTELWVKEVCYPDNNWKQGEGRGLALIVSMEKTRPGAGVDRGRLETLFRACGFTEVQHLVDAKASQLVDKIKSVAEKDILEVDECFVCSINAHGGTTKDGKPFIIDEDQKRVMVIPDIVEPFRQCKHLLGKPKIFFINCCRVNSDSVEADHDHQQGTGSLSRSLPELADTLLVFSTSEGCRSARRGNTGTIFVDELVQTVMTERHTRHVLDMMTMVNKRVMEVQNEVKDSTTGTTTIFGQCCELRSSFQRELYWKDTKPIGCGP